MISHRLTGFVKVFSWIIGLWLGGVYSSTNCFSQKLPPILFERLSLSDGLISNDVSALYQDHSGFIWIGTWDGLQKYDGQNFATYASGSGTSPKLLSNGIINTITQTPEGDIWVSTEMGGHCRINPENHEITVYNQRKTGVDDLYFDRGVQAVSLPGKKVLLASRGGLYRVDSGQISPRLWPETRDIGGVPRQVVSDRKGQVWIAAQNELSAFGVSDILEYSGPTGELKANFMTSFTFRISAMHCGASGIVWLASQEPKIYRIDPETFQIDSFAFLPNPGENRKNLISGMYEGLDGSIWLGTLENGLWKLSADSGELQPYTAHPLIPESRLPATISSLMGDRQGNIWIGTQEGVFRFHPDDHPFLFIPPVSESKLLSEPEFSKIVQLQSGDRYLSSWKYGLFRLDSANQLVKIVARTASGKDIRPSFIFKDHSEKLWLGTFEGLYRYDPETGAVVSYPEIQPWFQKAIFGMDEDSAGNIWIGMPIRSLLRLNPETHEVTAFDLPFPGDPEVGCRFISLCAGGDHRLWVGTAVCGLLTFDLQTLAFSPVEGLSAMGEGDPHENSLEEVELFGDSLFITTHSQGITIYEIKTGKATHLGMEQGLPGNRVMGLERVGRYYWIFTTNGLARMDAKSGKFTQFNHQNGLIQPEFTGQPSFDATQRKFYAATRSYLVQFSPEALTELPPPEPVQLLSVNLFGKSQPIGALENGKTVLHVPASANMLSIEFASLDFRFSQALLYQTQLEGFDTSWVDNGQSRVLRFTRLPGGNYTLRVRSRGVGGQWNAPSLLLRIHVQTPFYKTWWFALSVLAFIICIGYIIYRNRIRHLLEIMRIRNTISRDLHDEIGSSLSSISILSQIMLARNSGLEDDMRALLEKIRVQSGKSLESMDDIIWTIQAANDLGGKLAVRVRQAAADLLDDKGIEWSVVCSPEVEILPMKADFRWNCLMIIREALNNSVKYSQCSTVSVEMKKKGKFVCVRVVDDGIGFEIPTITNRNGLSNMQTRAATLKGKLDILTSPGNGTVIELQFPC